MWRRGWFATGGELKGAENWKWGWANAMKYAIMGITSCCSIEHQEDDSLNMRCTLREELIPMYSQESVDSS